MRTSIDRLRLAQRRLNFTFRICTKKKKKTYKVPQHNKTQYLLARQLVSSAACLAQLQRRSAKCVAISQNKKTKNETSMNGIERRQRDGRRRKRRRIRTRVARVVLTSTPNDIVAPSSRLRTACNAQLRDLSTCATQIERSNDRTRVLA